MTCDDALTYALAPGPRPTEVEDHLSQCARCASELESLRRLERTLLAAAPPVQDTTSLEAAVISRVAGKSQMGRAWLSAAAALFLAFGLATVWFGRAVPREAPVPAGALPAAVFHAPEEDSTAGLLQAYEPYAADLPQIQPDDLSSYLSPTDQGGWNG